jgi:DNA processing protein
MNGIIYDIWLSLACTPDSATFPRLIEKYSSAREIYEAPDKELSRTVGHNATDKRALINKDLSRAEKIYEFCTKKGVGLLPYFGKAFPASLKSIPTPPVLLYYRGTLPDFDNEFFVSVVGTRMLSDYGRRSAFRISYDLASSGAVIVSGMATGIDGVAHAGALSAGSSTVAVLGSGIDVCYPAVHLTLAREIVKSGCVITEYAPGTKPNKYNFPRRNRIISGLSSATFVVEGHERSGSLITARHAIAQKRTVYALPANVGSKNAEVTTLLLKNGAKILTAAEDIINDFEPQCGTKLNRFKLTERCPVEMNEALRRYSVSALCPSDELLSPPKRTNRVRAAVSRNVGSEHSFGEHSEKMISQVACTEKAAVYAVEEREPDEGFGATAIKIYKSIPLHGDCAIDELVEGEFTLREVMKSVLKLEMGGFIERLPGERIKRKSI